MRWSLLSLTDSDVTAFTSIMPTPPLITLTGSSSIKIAYLSCTAFVSVPRKIASTYTLKMGTSSSMPMSF